MNLDDAPTLREHLERINADSWKHHERVHQMEQLALNEAREQINGRLEKLNELRAEVVKDRDEYMRREVSEKIFSNHAEKILELQRFQARMVGIGLVLALVSGTIGAALMRIFWR